SSGLKLYEEGRRAMARRLTEEDIRRIFREEAEREKRAAEKLAALDDDVRKTWERLRETPIKIKESAGLSRPYASDIDWPATVQEIVDTYWKVVEEECNEPS